MMALFRKKKRKLIEDETAVTVEQEQQEKSDEETVSTTLSFHEDWIMEPEERFVYQYYHQQLPKLKPNQISISGNKLIEYEEGFVVVAFLRNTLPKPIKFEKVNLLLIDENGTPFAKKQFEMDDFGELPPNSCRPWRFLFSKEDRLTDTIPSTKNWKIAFELQSHNNERNNHKLELESSWENQISPAQKEHLLQLLKKLPPLKTGEVNFVGIEAKFVQEGSFAVTVLIRNGSTKNIRLEQIPLVVEDGDGDIICQGGFTLNLEVQANTSKPWTFIFPNQLVLKTNPNLTGWKVYPPTSQS